MVPVFSLNLFPPFIAPNRGNVFLGMPCSEIFLRMQTKSVLTGSINQSLLI